MNILITGACGFIGKRLTAYLTQQGYDVFALDILPPEHLSGLKVKKYFQQDLSRPFTLDASFDFVFHFGAYNVTHVGDLDPRKYTESNVRGTENLLRAASIRNLIFLSTIKVYKQDGRPLDETSPLDPLRDYEKSKLAAEKVCQENFHGETLCILRSVNIVGPGQSPKAILPVFFDRAMRHQDIEIFIPRDSLVMFVDVDDVVRLAERCVEKGGVPGTFNVVPSEKIRVDDLAEAIIRLTGSRSKVIFSHEGGPAVQSEVRSKHLQETFGWEAGLGLEDILKKYYRYVKNPVS